MFVRRCAWVSQSGLRRGGAQRLLAAEDKWLSAVTCASILSPSSDLTAPNFHETDRIACFCFNAFDACRCSVGTGL
jgi:hypothetical protein